MELVYHQKNDEWQISQRHFWIIDKSQEAQ